MKNIFYLRAWQIRIIKIEILDSFKTNINNVVSCAGFNNAKIAH